MSVQTLYTAATGMEAMETKLDIIANNLANVNTTAYKKARGNFEDLFYRQEVLPGSEDQSGGITSTGTAIGLGASLQHPNGLRTRRVSSILTDHWMWPLSAKASFKLPTLMGRLFTLEPGTSV